VTESEFLDQLEAWALGGLAPDERAAMERFADEHPAVRPAVMRAFETAAALGRAMPPSAAPPGAWGRIERELDGAATTAKPPALASRRRAWATAGWVLAAAAAILALWLWRDRDARIDREEVLARELSELRGRDALVDETVALLELAGTQIIPLEPLAAGTGIEANAVYHRGVKRAYVVVKGLPREAGYRIWVNRAGQRLEAGRLSVDRDGGVIASVAANSLDDVPESFEITRDNGAVVLQSRVKI
jgi:hypothetical protein